MIEATGVALKLGGKTIVEALDCRVPAGQVTVLMGKNGAGKSTLLRALAGELRPERGSIKIKKKSIHEFTVQQLANYRAVLFQSMQLAYPLTVEEVIEIGSYNQYQKLTQKERLHLLDAEIEQLELEDLRRRLFPTLSGGEQKRVLLAKCLVQLRAGYEAGRNQYLLLDEPTAALDVAQQYRFMELATQLAKERGIGVLAVLHDLNLAARFADQVILLKNGRVAAAGSIKKVLTKAHIADVFSVESFIQPHPHFNIPLITTYGNYSRIEKPASYA